MRNRRPHREPNCEDELIRRALTNDDVRVHLDPCKLREIRGGHSIEKWAFDHDVSPSWLVNKIEWTHDRRYVKLPQAIKYAESIGIPLHSCLHSCKMGGETYYIMEGAYFPDISPQLGSHLRPLAALALTIAGDGDMDNTKCDNTYLRAILEAHAALYYREKKFRREYANRKRRSNEMFRIALELVLGAEMATFASKDIAALDAEEEVDLPLGLLPDGFKACENYVSQLLDLLKVDLNPADRSVSEIIYHCKDLLAETKRDRRSFNPWIPERDLDSDASHEFDYLLFRLSKINGLNAATVYDMAIEISYGHVLAGRIDANHPLHMEQLLELDQDVMDAVERVKKFSERDREPNKE